MGKGGGCIPSKKKLPVNDQDPPLPPSNSPVPPEFTTTITQINETPTQMVQNQRIFIMHVEVLARRMKKGVDSIDGVEGVLYRVPETLLVEVLEQMRVPKKENNGHEGVVPVVSVDELVMLMDFSLGFL
ncbi:Quinone reductase family protein [Euphorbia peplus]|nr:Quinone reductase family protein [Euphorbia peplus]